MGCDTCSRAIPERLAMSDEEIDNLADLAYSSIQDRLPGCIMEYPIELYTLAFSLLAALTEAPSPISPSKELADLVKMHMSAAWHLAFEQGGEHQRLDAILDGCLDD